MSLILKKAIRWKLKESIRQHYEQKGRLIDQTTHEQLKKQKNCDLCYNTGPLEIHHIIPIRKGGSNDIWNLLVLCKKCHKQADKLNGGRKIWKRTK